MPGIVQLKIVTVNCKVNSKYPIHTQIREL